MNLSPNQYIIPAIAFILFIVVSIVIGILTRNFLLWYWRINDVVNHLANISAKLDNLEAFQKPSSESRIAPEAVGYGKAPVEVVTGQDGIKSPNSIR
jgi:hypothetical protein